LKDGVRGPELVGRLAGVPIVSSDVTWETKLGVLLGARVVVDEGLADQTFLDALGPAGKRGIRVRLLNNSVPVIVHSQVMPIFRTNFAKIDSEK
jgi:hypothetical protein